MEYLLRRETEKEQDSVLQFVDKNAPLRHREKNCPEGNGHGKLFKGFYFYFAFFKKPLKYFLYKNI